MFNFLDYLGCAVEVLLDNHHAKRWIVNRHMDGPQRAKRLNRMSNDPKRPMTREIALKDCEFFVDLEGRDRVLRSIRVDATGKTRIKKEIHAWVNGVIVHPSLVAGRCTAPVMYKPCPEHETFVWSNTRLPIYRARFAFFTVRNGWFTVLVPPDRREPCGGS